MTQTERFPRAAQKLYFHRFPCNSTPETSDHSAYTALLKDRLMHIARKFRFLPILLATLILGATTISLRADTAPTTAPNARLRVLVKPAEPFSFEKNGQLTGYSVELWKQVAEEAGLQYDVKMVNTVPELLTALKNHEADLGVGAISVTQEREKVLDFSHPFFKSGLQILAPSQGSGSALAAFGALLRGDVLTVIALLLAAIFVLSNFLWFFERKANEDEFPRPYKSGVWEASWWAASTIISGGCENKSPTSVAGRLVAVVWMLGGIGLTSYITATLAAAMTVNTLNSDINSLADLKGQTIGTVAGSSTESYLMRQSFKPKTYPTVNAAIEDMEKGKLKAVVYDSPMLRYYLATHADSKLQLAGDVFENQDYGFVMPLGTPYRKRINEAYLKLEDDGFRNTLEKKWFAAKE
jgi:ABC-type amino acid transport substrate-binding protein